MWKRVSIFILSILIMIAVWVTLLAVAQLTYGTVATMGIVILGFVLIPVLTRFLIGRLIKKAGSKKLDA